MIISVAKLVALAPELADVNGEALQAQLEALESLIRNHTHNNFQKRNIRTIGRIENGTLAIDYPYIQEGDTVEISRSKFNDGLYVIGSDTGRTLYDEDDVLVTKVEYPADIQLGVIDLIKWEKDNRKKVGVQSETISRHSVTYFNMDGTNSIAGYPKALVDFLKPHMKARF